MTVIDKNGNLIIAAEPPGLCMQCGATAETRPYGPGGIEICCPCGDKDPDTKTRFFNLLDGKTVDGKPR